MNEIPRWNQTAIPDGRFYIEMSCEGVYNYAALDAIRKKLLKNL